MNETTITPALTEAEWRTVKLWSAGKMIGGKVRGMVVLDLPETHKAGAAACALYGQPFGFTVDDAELLENMAATYSIRGALSRALVAELDSLASRIRALLPPASGSSETASP